MTAVPVLATELGLATDTARQWSALASLAGEPITLGPIEITFSLAAAPSPAAVVAAVSTRTGLRAIVRLADFPFKTQFGIDLGEADVEALPATLRRAILEGVVEMVWGAMPETGLGPLSVGAVGPLAEQSGHLAPAATRWLSVTVKGAASGPVAVLVGLEAAALARWIGTGRIAPHRVWAALKTRIDVEAVHRLGRLALPAAEMRGLGPGDLIVMPTLAEGRAEVVVDGMVFELARAGDRWTVAGRHRDGRAPIPANGAPTLNDPTQTGGTLDIQALPLTLDFEIGRTTLPLADLEAWQVGATVPIGVPDRAAGVEVTIRANGAVVGLGDLVKIDDRLAVRLTRLFITR